MQDNQEFKTEELLQQILAEDSPDFNIATALDVSERVQQSRRLTRQVLEEIRVAFKHKNSDVVLKAVLLLESLVKNSNEHFHFEVGEKKFQDSILALLKIKRGRASLVDKLLAKEKNWRQIENKVLYLYQLWADTFMMVEDQYPNIMENYKLLRKENVQFPARDPSEKFMIKFEGAKSPIFEVLEDVSKREKEEERRRQHNKMNFERQKKGLAPREYVPEKDDDEDEQGIKKPSINISQDEIDSLKENMQLLLAIMENAQKYEELNTEFASEILSEITKIKDKISKAYKFKCFKNENHKALCVDVYQESKRLIASFEEKGKEFEQLNEALQKSAMEDIKQKQESGKKEEKPQEEEEQKNEIDLLDFEPEPVQQKVQPPQQQIIPTPQGVNNVQQQNTKPKDDLLDLFEDNPVPQPQQQQPQQNIQNNFVNQQVNNGVGFNNQQMPVQQGFQQQGFQQQNTNPMGFQQQNNVQQQQNKDVDLLFDDGISKPQPQVVQQPVQNFQQQQKQQQQSSDIDDLFGDSVPQQNQQQQQQQQQVKKDDDDDFFDSIANRK